MELANQQLSNFFHPIVLGRVRVGVNGGSECL
jgi:hypothetical protein